MTTVKPIYRKTVSGLGSVGSYQVSGHPFMKVVTDIDAETPYTFLNVTRSILIKNTSSVALKIHFAAAANGPSAALANYWTLSNNGDSIEMKIKCKKIYITPDSANGSFEMFAELTHIPASDMYDLDKASLPGISLA